MKTIRLSNLRSDFARVCKEVYRGNIPHTVTCEGEPVVKLLHPDNTPKTRELTRMGVVGARAYLTDLWEEVSVKGGHVVITFHGEPRVVMVPYVEPEAT